VFSDFVLVYFSFLPVIYSLWIVRYWSKPVTMCLCCVCGKAVCLRIFSFCIKMLCHFLCEMFELVFVRIFWDEVHSQTNFATVCICVIVQQFPLTIHIVIYSVTKTTIHNIIFQNAFVFM
jgi:hypothetical protein